MGPPTPLPLSQEEIDEIRKVRRVWHLEELKNWNLRPTGHKKEVPLTDEELEFLADQLVETDELEDLSHNPTSHRRLNYINTHPKSVGNIIIAKDLLEGNPQVEELKKKIIDEYRDTVFKDEVWADPPVRHPLGFAEIKLKPGVVPIKQRPFTLAGERREAVTDLVKKFEAQGLLEEAVSPWLSPAFPVPKKEPGSWRLVIDYRLVNEATITDAYPTPLIEDILIRQGTFNIWSILDMKHGFHQVPLLPESRPITAMSTPLGPRQWKVLPMGVKNGTAIFQRLMDTELKDFEFADPYIDDTIVGSTGATREEAIANHEKDLRQVLERFKKDKLVVDIHKTHFFTTKVEFCGYIPTQGTRSPAPKKLLSIQKWELPKTVTALRAFLGLTNYYSNYVQNYAHYAAPLTSKLCLNRVDGKKGSKKVLLWTEEEIAAFEDMKTALGKSLALFHMKVDQPFILETDASRYAIGAVLKQEQNGETVPVAFMSRKLAKNKRNWTPREQETYAMVMALRKWAGWIGYQPVVVKTDHKSLEHWVTEHVDTPSGPASRRARWHETLSKFNVEVTYNPGKDNLVADTCSRWMYPASQGLADISKHGNRESMEECEAIIAEEEREEEEEAAKAKVGIVGLGGVPPA